MRTRNQPESNEFKPRGGKRPGAGRKKGTIEAITLAKRKIAERVFDYVKDKTNKTIEELWFPLVTSEDYMIRGRALCYLVDRLEGKAKETHEVIGEIHHTMTAEEREAERKVIQKLLPPAEQTIEVSGKELN